jgi:hypothetical protein
MPEQFLNLPAGIATKEAAKAFLAGGEVVWSWANDYAEERHVQMPDGSVWCESEMLLDWPRNDYCLHRLS